MDQAILAQRRAELMTKQTELQIRYAEAEQQAAAAIAEGATVEVATRDLAQIEQELDLVARAIASLDAQAEAVEAEALQRRFEVAQKRANEIDTEQDKLLARMLKSAESLLRDAKQVRQLRWEQDGLTRRYDLRVAPMRRHHNTGVPLDHIETVVRSIRRCIDFAATHGTKHTD